MANYMTIFRDTKIKLEEVVNAVNEIENMKIDSMDDEVFINQKTKEKIVIPSGNDHLIYIKFDDTEDWEISFRYKSRSGDIVFKPCEELDNPNYPIRIAAAKLAKILKAKISYEGSGKIYKW